MKILIVSPTHQGIGGVARHVQGLVNFLKQNGHQVDVISSENTFTIPVRKLKNPSFMISSFLKTRFKKDYDVIHAQNPPAALALTGVRAKKILSLHGVHHEQVELLHGNTVGEVAKGFEKHALSWADAITVSSKELYEHYTKIGYKVQYLPNAIDISSLPAGVDRRYEKQVTYAARMSKEKGILDILKMAEKLPEDIHLLLLGSGPEEELVKKTCENKKNLHFLGYQEKEKTIEIMRGSDIVIQPSIMEGGLSYTRLEAMACKVPLISTVAGGSKDALHHLENAYLVKPNNPDELLGAILELMSDDKKRKTIADNAFQTVQEYDWKIVGKKYLKLYNDLLK
ncbi:MAG TPA: glycosyltransferase family 4 protein [Candidatus Nitrosotalea sp.]|nr:glycosyltransferase family 4 protein [Candidatus Nitrosotalea sp.]